MAASIGWRQFRWTKVFPGLVGRFLRRLLVRRLIVRARDDDPDLQGVQESIICCLKNRQESLALKKLAMPFVQRCPEFCCRAIWLRCDCIASVNSCSPWPSLLRRQTRCQDAHVTFAVSAESSPRGLSGRRALHFVMPGTNPARTRTQRICLFDNAHVCRRSLAQTIPAQAIRAIERHRQAGGFLGAPARPRQAAGEFRSAAGTAKAARGWYF
jgi:hypothetical protein